MANKKISQLTELTTPTDTDVQAIVNSSETKKVTWANIKATLKSYFDTLYGTMTNVVEDTTPQLGGNLDGQTFDITTTGTTTTKSFNIAPPVDQNITAATDTIGSAGGYYDLVPDADYVLTSTPNITAGTSGDILILHNTTSFTIDLQDESILAGSGVTLDGASGTIKANGHMMLMFDDDNTWHILSNPNTASAGANATTLNVRNVSGASIAAGSPVYITGWNVGQNRPTIDLADANVSASMPAIGVTASAIATGANGEVITFGNAIGIIDTSTASVGDPVYVSTTAGAVTFTRPTVDAIQKIGVVARSHATSGVVLIIGAGRTNDTPISIPDLTTATTQSVGDNSTKLATTAYADTTTKMFMVRLLDSTTDLSADTGVGGEYRISPKKAITITGVGAYVDTAAATGSNKLTIDINEAGTSILSTKITLDVGEKTSTTAVTAPVISDSSIAADAIITFDIDQVNETTVAKGLVIWIEYHY